MSYLNDLLGKFFGNKNNDGRSTESNSPMRNARNLGSNLAKDSI